MRISTPQYLRKLTEMVKDLREVVAILGECIGLEDEIHQIHYYGCFA